MSEKKLEDRRNLRIRSDIYKKGKDIILRMEMPGVDKDSLDVTVDGNKLIIHGEKKQYQWKGKYLLHEVADGVYHKVYTLDETVNTDKLEATFKNGVVTVSLATKESEKAKKIKVVAK